MKYESVRQETITLQHFDYEVPALYPEDGEAYIPVLVVCKMLGIRADTRIRRWRHLLLWQHARKLPWRTTEQRTSIVWCLHLGALPFLFSCFDWSYVHPDRLEQLRKATDESLDVLEQAQKQKEARYRKLRQLLFPFLIKMVDTDQRLQEKALDVSSSLTVISQKRLDVLVQIGCKLIRDVTAFAKNMLHEMGTSWIVDGIQIDEEGHITDTFSMPLFPVLPKEEDIDAFLQSGRMLLLWYDDLDAFLQEHGLPRILLID